MENASKSALALSILSTSVSALLCKKNPWNNCPKFSAPNTSLHFQGVFMTYFPSLLIWKAGRIKAEGSREEVAVSGRLWDALRAPLAAAWRRFPARRRGRPCCCGLAAAGAVREVWRAVPGPPPRRPPGSSPPARSGPGLGELSTEGGAEGREGAEGRGHLRFSPPLISSLPSAAILHPRS